MKNAKLYQRLEGEAPPGSFSQYDIAVMYPELQKLTEKDVYLEVGVQYGRSLYIASKYSKAEAFGVDIQPTLCSVWLEREGLEYSYAYMGSDKAAKGWKKAKPISLLFIDGDHTYEGVKRDIKNWAKFVKKGGVILFHDCDSTSPGVVKAVEEAFPKYEKFVDTIGKTSMAKVVI